METLETDICVIGAGSAGLTVAAGAAQLGRAVVLIEQGEMGGDCLNTGCVPSKSLIAAANRAQAIRKSGAFGVHAGAPDIDAARVHAHVRDAVDTIAPNDSQARFEQLGVTVIRAPARFLDSACIEAGGKRIRARRFVVATGSRPGIPSIPGLDRVSYFTNETIFEKDFIPPHLIVIGAGPVGMELAQAHRRLGSQVTVIETMRALSHEDQEAARLVVTRLMGEGVRLLEQTKIDSVGATTSGVIVNLAAGETINGSHLLVATGRKPNVEDLQLEEAGVAFDAKGIKVDRALRTTNKRIYAIGDIAGGLQFTHVANYQASLVIRNAVFRLPVRLDESAIPRVTFIDPELAQAGLTESEARAKHRAVSVARSEFADNDRAVTERMRDGFVKAIVGGGGAILGATIVGPHAGDLILPWVMAIRKRLTLREMTGFIVPYPTFSEASKRAASSYYAPMLFSPRIRALARVLSWFG
jgi:pyruvate/2-oxoglutarate dehydrogenase complex dihydrolipoamide dehydrogenase (E3) component